ncbi:MAG: DMT family transporter [Rhodobacteraceae bacterium]|nr:DMT family transporter [Paracoccaceae bacterium]
MRPLRGIALKVLSVTLFAVLGALVKAVAGEVPTGQIVFFRAFFALLVILVWLAWTHDLRSGLKTKRPGSHVARGMIGTAALGLTFAGLGMLPLPEVTAIGYAAPLLLVVLAGIILREPVGVFRLSTVALGLVGVMVILAPRLTVLAGGALGDREALGAVLVLIAAFCVAVSQILVRTMVGTETTAAIVFYFSVTAAGFALLTLPFGWVLPGPWTLAALVTIGLLGGIGQVILTTAYRHADASLIAPFEYASMLMAVAIGYFVFAEVPTLHVAIGSAIVVAAALIIIWREHRLGLKRAEARKVSPPPG